MAEYSVSTWDEFMEVCGKNASNTITWTAEPGTVIDFNEIQPEGYSSPIQLLGDIDFNGVIFRHFCSTSYIAFRKQDSKTIKNMILEDYIHNFAAPTNGTGAFLARLFSTGGTNSTPNPIFYNCRISGTSDITSPKDTYIYSLFGADADDGYSSSGQCTISRCGIDVTVTTNRKFIPFNGTGSKGGITNSEIILDAVQGSGTIFSRYPMYNNRFKGRFDSDSGTVNLSVSQQSRANVFYMDSNCTLQYDGLGKSLFVSDKREQSTDTSLIICSSAHAKDVAWLESVRFPIGGL